MHAAGYIKQGLAQIGQTLVDYIYIFYYYYYFFYRGPKRDQIAFACTQHKEHTCL